MADAGTRNAPVAVTWAFVALGVVFAVIGAIYLSRTAGQLPAFFPGHTAGSAHHHAKHGLLAFGLAVLSWIAAWFSTGHRTAAA